LYWYSSRWYDSQLAHFTQPDSIIPDPGDAASYDRFVYSINNPLRYVDPSGHWYCDPKQCGYLHDNDDGSTASPGSPLNDLITWINDYGSQATFADTSWFVEHPDYDPENDAFLKYAEQRIQEDGNYLGITQADIDDVRRYYSLVNKSQNFNLWDFLVGAAQEAGPPLFGAVLNTAYGKDVANASNYRTLLKAYTGKSGEGLVAHHTLPQKFVKDFTAAGINIHDPIYLSWVDPYDHAHWSYAYNKKWERFLAQPRTPDEILRFANDLSVEYQYDVYFTSP